MARKKDEVRTAKLQFHYIKGPLYREVTCNGVVGGITPRGDIWMGIFSERGPIPRVIEYEVEAKGGVTSVQFNESEAEPSLVDTRHGVIRHIEMGAYLDVEAATRLHAWLGDRLEEKSKMQKPKGKK